MERGLPRDGWGYANHFNSVKQPLAQNGNKLTALSLPAPRRVAEHRQKRPSPHRPHHLRGLTVLQPYQYSRPSQPFLPTHTRPGHQKHSHRVGKARQYPLTRGVSAPGSCQRTDATSLQIKHIATGCFHGNEHLRYSRHRSADMGGHGPTGSPRSGQDSLSRVQPSRGFKTDLPLLAPGVVTG